MWQKAKRAVSESVARDIASVAADYGIQSVGVFVDESAQQIQDACGQCGIHVAQLHGPEARKALFQLPENLHVSFVMNCNAQGRIQTPTPAILAEQTEQVLHRYNAFSPLSCASPQIDMELHLHTACCLPMQQHAKMLAAALLDTSNMPVQ